MKYVLSGKYIDYINGIDGIYTNWANRPLKYLFQIYIPVDNKTELKNPRAAIFINMDKWI